MLIRSPGNSLLIGALQDIDRLPKRWFILDEECRCFDLRVQGSSLRFRTGMLWEFNRT